MRKGKYVTHFLRKKARRQMKKFRGRLFNRAYILKNYISLVSFLINMKPSQLSPTIPSAPVSIYLRFCFSGLTLNFFFLRFFFTWTSFLKVFIEFVMILLLFYVLVFWPWGMWILAPWPRIRPTPSLTEGKVLTIGPRKSWHCMLIEGLECDGSVKMKVKFPNMTNFPYPFRHPAVSRRV